MLLPCCLRRRLPIGSWSWAQANHLAPERMALRHSPKRTIRPAITEMRVEVAEAESVAPKISASEVTGEAETDERGKALLGVGVDRSDDSVDFIRTHCDDR